MLYKYNFKGTSGLISPYGQKEGYWEEKVHYLDGGYYHTCGNYINGLENGIWYEVEDDYTHSKTLYVEGSLVNSKLYRYDHVRYTITIFNREIHYEDDL